MSDSIRTVERAAVGGEAQTLVATADALVGRVLDAKYELLGRLGEGGMGAVYRARRVHIGDEVAVKILHPKFFTDEAAVERFRREARAAAQLHHANVVTIHDYGEARGNEGFAYIVMELVGGSSLRELLKREGRLDAERAVALMRDICAGVGAAHRRNIVHRDVKPDNIIVIAPDDEHERETVKVVDFGIAKLRDLASDNTLTQAGDMVGTPYYMSPEQCRGESLDARADVYSLGAMLYEMLAGAPPFTAPSVTGVIARHLTEQPPPMPAVLNVPHALEAVLMRALAKDPGARQTDAAELARELQSAARSAPADEGRNEGGIAAPIFPHTPRPVSVSPNYTSQPHAAPPTHARVQHSGQPPAVHMQTPASQFAPQAHAQFRPPVAGPPRKKSRLPLIIGLLVLFTIVVSGLGLAAWMIAREASRRNAAADAGANRAARRNAANTANAVDASKAAEMLPSPAMRRAEGKVISNTLLTADDLASLTPREMRLLRNTIFARYGRTFGEPELKRYFQSRPWYQPRDNYSEDKLTDTDRANAVLVDSIEKGGVPVAVDAGKVRREVTDVLDEWAETTREGDLDAHMSFYADNLETFYQGRSIGASQVRRERARAFDRYPEMDVKVENVDVKPDASGTRATVTFDKTWKFEGDERRSNGSVRQMLILTKFGDDWRITGEKDLQVHYSDSREP